MINQEPTPELERRCGWNAIEIAHAEDAAGDEYGPEDFAIFHGGRAIMFPPAAEELSYIRVVQEGCEIAYWDCEEWRDDPADVFGAIIGTVADQALAAGPYAIALPQGDRRTLEAPNANFPCNWLRLVKDGESPVEIDLIADGVSDQKLRAFFNLFSMKA